MQAQAPSQPSERSDRLSRGLEPVSLGDKMMVGLAVVDILLLFAADAYAAFLPTFVRQLVVPIDLAVVAVFALVFLVGMAKADRRLAFARNHWYDVVGMVPVASAGLRAFRLVRLVRMYVVARLDWEGEASWHSAFVRGVIFRYRDIIVQEITQPIILTGIRLVKEPLRRARFAAVIGSTMDTQRRQVHAVVKATLRNTKGVKNLAGTKAGQRLTHAVTDAVMDTVVETLKSDEVNELMANSMESVLTEVAQNVGAVRRPDAVEAAQPGPSQPARGV